VVCPVVGGVGNEPWVLRKSILVVVTTETAEHIVLALSRSGASLDHLNLLRILLLTGSVESLQLKMNVFRVITLMLDAVRTSETSAYFYETTSYHVPEGYYL
jgi:hypothetical protein